MAVVQNHCAPIWLSTNSGWYPNLDLLSTCGWFWLHSQWGAPQLADSREHMLMPEESPRLVPLWTHLWCTGIWNQLINTTNMDHNPHYTYPGDVNIGLIDEKYLHHFIAVLWDSSCKGSTSFLEQQNIISVIQQIILTELKELYLISLVNTGPILKQHSGNVKVVAQTCLDQCSVSILHIEVKNIIYTTTRCSKYKDAITKKNDILCLVRPCLHRMSAVTPLVWHSHHHWHKSVVYSVPIHVKGYNTYNQSSLQNLKGGRGRGT